MTESLEQLVGRALEIDPERVVPELEFGGVPEWDSLAHVDLMLALEERLGTEIDAEQIVELTSFLAIQAFVEAREQA